MNICQLCALQEANRNVTNNELFLDMLQRLYSITAPDISFICTDCRDQTVHFHLHTQAVSRKQSIYTELVGMDAMIGKASKRYCRLCVVVEGIQDVTKLPKFNRFITDVYKIQIDGSGEDHTKFVCSLCFEKATYYYAIRCTITDGHEFQRQILIAQQLVNAGGINDYANVPNAPIRRSSSISTVYDLGNPLLGFRSGTESVGSGSSSSHNSFDDSARSLSMKLNCNET